MESLEAILSKLRIRSDCSFDPPAGLPALPSGLCLPDDLRQFYELHAEARLFVRTGVVPYRIVRPSDFAQIGMQVFGEATRGVQRSWYAAVDLIDGDYLAVDLGDERRGWCYDCFHEDIAPTSCRVVARSFTELMNRVAIAGDESWWLAPGFEGHGYARNKSDRINDDWIPASWLEDS